MESRSWIQCIFTVVIVVTFAVAGAGDPGESSCEFGKVDGLLDAALDLFKTARKTLVNAYQQAVAYQQAGEAQCHQKATKCPVVAQPWASPLPQDCSDLILNGTKTSGVYRILPGHRMFYETDGFDVYCDMDTDGGGWTVIQKRGNYGRPKDYFYKDWEYYKNGFGDITQDFWLGNDKIYALTNQKLYSLRFDLKNWEEEQRFAVYKQFWIYEEALNYKLHAADYNGTAGESFVVGHNEMLFSTPDRDNDNTGSHCAVENQGSWWYQDCNSKLYSNLNGLYYKGTEGANLKSVSWNTWKGDSYSLMETEMKIRPANFSLTAKVLKNG